MANGLPLNRNLPKSRSGRHRRSSGKYSRGRSLSDARNVIRHAGLRATAPRLAVLGMLLRERRPLSHSEISRALRNEGLDRVTVFRNLQDLAEASILSRVDIGDHTWRFEPRSPESPQGRPHSHFVCERCNLVSCLNDFSLGVLPQSSELGAIVASVSEVVLRGCCRHC
jgi:Fur family transcriptional regulator, ferric uptake regulator